MVSPAEGALTSHYSFVIPDAKSTPKPLQPSFAPTSYYSMAPGPSFTLAHLQFEQDERCFSDPSEAGDTDGNASVSAEYPWGQAGLNESYRYDDALRADKYFNVTTSAYVVGTLAVLVPSEYFTPSNVTAITTRVGRTAPAVMGLGSVGTAFKGFGLGYLASRATSVTLIPYLEAKGINNPYLLRGIEFGAFWAPNAIYFGMRKTLGWSAYLAIGKKVAASTAFRAANVVGWVALAGELTLQGAKYAIVKDPYMRSVMARAKIRWKENQEGAAAVALYSTDFLVSALADSLVPDEYLDQIEAEDQAAIVDFYNMLGGALLTASIQYGGVFNAEVVEEVLNDLFAIEGGREYLNNVLALIEMKKGDHIQGFERPLLALAGEDFEINDELMRSLQMAATVDYKGDGGAGVPLVKALKDARGAMAVFDALADNN